MNEPDWVQYCLSNPDWARRQLLAIEAEESLLAFVECTWEILHPERPLVKGWALEAICEHLEAVGRGQIKKLLINVPPGCMKSLAVNVFFPAWIWGPRGRAHTQFISWSYAEALTIRDNRKFRLLVTSQMFRELWGDRFALAGDQNEKKLLENDRRGFKLASGIHGGGTGHRGDILVWDDPHKVREAESEVRREAANQWLTETLPTRKNDAEAAFVGIMQRIHERDCSGTVLAADLGYEHLCLPMEYEADHPHPSRTSLHFVDPRTEEGELLWPERFTAEDVADLKESMRAWGGTYAEVGQLQQRPSPRGGGMFKRKHFEIRDEAPAECRMIVRGWDLAATSRKKNKAAAYTAGVKIGLTPERRLVVLDVRRIQGSDREVEELIRSTALADGEAVLVDIPQDPGQSGVAQKSALARLLLGFQVFFSPESGSKPDRARPFAAQVEAGNVSLVRAPWNDPYLNEAETFPNGRFMDQIDATSRAAARLMQMADSSLEGFAIPELYVGDVR